jgi:hypothetical protein
MFRRDFTGSVPVDGSRKRSWRRDELSGRLASLSFRKDQLFFVIYDSGMRALEIKRMPCV